MVEVQLPETGVTMQALGCAYGPHKVLHVTSNGTDNHFVVCSECGAEGPAADTEEEAVNLWNTRSGETFDGAPTSSPVGATPAEVLQAGESFLEKFDGKIEGPEVLDLLYRAMRDADKTPGLPDNPMLTTDERKQLEAFFRQVVFHDYLPDNPKDLRSGIEARYLMHRLLQHQLGPSLAESLPDALRYRELVEHANDGTPLTDKTRYIIGVEMADGRIRVVHAPQVAQMLDKAIERRQNGDANPVAIPAPEAEQPTEEQYKDHYSYFFSYSHLAKGAGFGFGSTQRYLRAPITSFEDLKMVANDVLASDPRLESVNVLNYQLLRGPIQ